jgi:hypothetical protein
MKKIVFLLFITLSLRGNWNHVQHCISLPYITGDGFRVLADYLFVETTEDWELPLIAQLFKEGQIIFVKTENLKRFFEVLHPQLKNYILISHNSDVPSPSPFESYLDSPKLIAWFCENCDTKKHHPKLFRLPIGICNGHSMRDSRGLTSTELTALREQYATVNKDIMLYMNFTVHAGVPDRQLAYRLFRNQPFCYTSGEKGLRQYLHDVARSKFVLCPPGGGEDCYRTWEALLLGAIPIVRSSGLDPLFEDLPVLIINDWRDITPNFLETKYQEMKSKKYNMEKMFMSYWSNLINEAQHRYYTGR